MRKSAHTADISAKQAQYSAIPYPVLDLQSVVGNQVKAVKKEKPPPKKNTPPTRASSRRGKGDERTRQGGNDLLISLWYSRKGDTKKQVSSHVLRWVGSMECWNKKAEPKLSIFFDKVNGPAPWL